jgi:hypothetical protein
VRPRPESEQMKTRSPKPDNRTKPESRIGSAVVSGFGFRVSELVRHSALGLRHCFLLLPLSFSLCALSFAAEAPPPAKKGTLLFSDDFNRAEIGPRWDTSLRTFSTSDGALKGGQVLGKHGAVAGVSVPFQDAVIEFRFRFEGAASINAVCDDKTFTGSHAGHICRVTITPKLLRLGDDREGGMRNDIYEMRQDTKRKAEGDKLLAGRTATFPMPIATNQWHHLAMEIVGDEMRVSVNGKFVGQLKSPGLAHPTKSRFHFTISGQHALIDDVKIWAAGATGAK